jgi:hypothetical protein
LGASPEKPDHKLDGTGLHFPKAGGRGQLEGIFGSAALEAEGAGIILRNLRAEVQAEDFSAGNLRSLNG